MFFSSFGTKGDKQKINITILVDHSTAPALNLGKESLDDILILHVENSKDHFITACGNYLPSSFGNDLDVLSFLRRPVRSYQFDDLRAVVRKVVEEETRRKGGSTGASAFPSKLVGLVSPGKAGEDEKAGKEEERLSVPKEMWRLIDFIYRYGMDVDNLFASPPDQSVVEYIRECLDTGVEFDYEALLAEVDEDEEYDEGDEDGEGDEDSSTGTSTVNDEAQNGDGAEESGTVVADSTTTANATTTVSSEVVDESQKASGSEVSTTDKSEGGGQAITEDQEKPSDQQVKISEVRSAQQSEPSSNISTSAAEAGASRETTESSSTSGESVTTSPEPTPLLPARSPSPSPAAAAVVARPDTPTNPSKPSTNESPKLPARPATPSILTTSTTSTTVTNADTTKQPSTKKRLKPVGRPVAVHSMVEVLCQFLDSLVEPVVPFAAYARCVDQGYSSLTTATQILQTPALFPPVHYNVFVYITSFLKEVLSAYKGRGEVTVERLAWIFSSILLRPPSAADLLQIGNNSNLSVPKQQPTRTSMDGAPPGYSTSSSKRTSTASTSSTSSTSSSSSSVSYWGGRPKYATVSGRTSTGGILGAVFAATSFAAGGNTTTTGGGVASGGNGKVMVSGGYGGAASGVVAGSAGTGAKSDVAFGAGVAPMDRVLDVENRKRRMFVMLFIQPDS
ncbi:Type II inositol 1,4,5-trisphosphate 5-phosphatase [Quaeritorhiza haematococci]|nr:Type II inositol 1,4,5-trisphosphate 5-phosphatase [Quaeritorhiza haematococci]